MRGRGRQELGGAQRAASSSGTARGRHGTCRKAEDRVEPTLPSGSLGFSPSLHLRARQAAGMGKKEHSTVRVSSCPGHPCQVLIET